jgi:hypothetical protein
MLVYSGGEHLRIKVVTCGGYVENVEVSLDMQTTLETSLADGG